MRPDAEQPAAPFIYTNLQTDACTSCNYDTNNGFLVLGPTNCFDGVSTQWLAYPFYAARTAAPRQINLAVTLDADICSNGANKFTAAIYDDACAGPNTLLTSAVGTAPAAPCALAVVRLRTPPTLTAGVKYWVVVTTAANQTGFTGVWWESNYAPGYVNFNDTNGWQLNAVGSPGGFSIQ
ncbi:MAG TPA: hypothetical protein VGI60_16260 [Chthoniobacterales bacterium]